MRLFIAIDLPRETKDKIDQLFFNLTKEIKSPIKWVENENLHINIKFLDEVAESKLDEIEGLIKEVTQNFNQQTLDINIQNVLVFPDINQPKVISLKIVSEDNLNKLAQELKIKFLQLPYIKKESKPFKPHLTLARVRFNLTRLEKEIISNIKFEDSFQVRDICLMSSRLTSSGPIYNIVKKFSL